MMDIRLKTVPFDFQGKTYQLACNMNVLDDVQEAYGGDFSAALRDKTEQSTLVFLAAMMSDYADSQGWPERFTVQDLRRAYGVRQLLRIKGIVMELIIDAIGKDSADDDASDSEPSTGEATALAESDAEKNRTAREDAAASTLPGI